MGIFPVARLPIWCNTGQDSLSLSHLGAQVTGIDVSDAAIAIARQLALDSRIACHFERADVNDWLAHTSATALRFDRVLCSYGVLCWLSDLYSWAQGVAQILVPGGRCVVIDFHPFSNLFDREWQLVNSYPAAGEVLRLHGIDDYVAESRDGLTPSGYASGV